MKATVKKILRCTLPVLLVGLSLVLFSVFAFAEEADPGDTWWSLDMETGVLTVEADIPDYDYFYNGPAPWSEWLEYIKEVRISEGVESIGRHAFQGCINLEAVTLPSTLHYIEEEAFYSCESLERFAVSAESEYFTCDAQGVLYSKDMTELILCPRAFRGRFTIPQGVMLISNQAFYDCIYITAVDFPDGLTIIREEAFRNCIVLEDLSLPFSLEHIDKEAFAGCYALKEVNIPENVDYMGLSVFRNCEDMIRVYLPASITDIEELDFRGCLALEEIYFRGCAPVFEAPNEPIRIPDGVTFYYIEGREGWTSPTWNGYNTKVWTGLHVIDVKEENYFYEPVRWALDQGITNGVGNDLFLPEGICTRGQVVTFLWRAKGCPEPKEGVNPFTDISPKDYYYKAVLWAAEEGITNGVGRNRFAPEEGCTRGQVVTFLWRANGKPEAQAVTDLFDDISEDAYYYRAVLWAVEQRITKGKTVDRFAPLDLCTRGQIVTFLWRAEHPYNPYYFLVKDLIENADEEIYFGQGFLYDLDGNGVEELILTYGLRGDHRAIYTIENGTAVPLLADEVYAMPVGGGRAHIGLVERDGKTYFYTLSVFYDMEHDETYGGMDFWAVRWKFYLPSEEGMSLTEDVSFIGYVAYDRETYEWFPVYEKCSFSINGEEKSAQTYEAWEAAIIRDRIAEITSGSGDSWDLDDIMTICKS